MKLLYTRVMARQIARASAGFVRVIDVDGGQAAQFGEDEVAEIRYASGGG